MAGLLAVFCFASLGAVAAEESKEKDKEGEHYSGYLGADIYARMVEVEVKNGAKVRRWIGPKLSFANYKKILIEPAVLYPEPKPGPQVSEETLDAIITYLTQKLDDKIGSVLNLTSEPGPEVARLQVALTGVDIETEGMKGYEVLPIAAVFGGLKAMTGNRAQDVTVFLEAKLSDSVTGEVIGAALRRVEGEQLKGSKDTLSLEDLKKSLDTAGDDTEAAFSETMKPPQ